MTWVRRLMRRLWPWSRIGQAKACYEEAQRDRPRVERLAHDLRARRQANHFSEQVMRALRGDG